MKYQIVTGYWSGKGWKGEDSYEKANFFDKFWYPNTARYAKVDNLLVVNPDSEILPENKNGQWLNLSHNLGHVHDLDHNDYYSKKFGGWSMTFIIGALTAYSNDCDFIFKEQDCLAFGPWVERMYEDLAKTQTYMLVGSQEHANGQGLEQSLMIIKHEFILPFVTSYLAFPHNDAGAGYVRPERKFRTVIDQNFPTAVSNLSFGFGRARPKHLPELPFYVQQINEDDLRALSKQGILL